MTKSEIWGETETDNTERAETDNTGRVETDNTGRAFLVSGAVAEQVWESQAASIAVPSGQDRKSQTASIAVTGPDGESLTASIAVTGHDRNS